MSLSVFTSVLAKPGIKKDHLTFSGFEEEATVNERFSQAALPNLDNLGWPSPMVRTFFALKQLLFFFSLHEDPSLLLWRWHLNEPAWLVGEHMQAFLEFDPALPCAIIFFSEPLLSFIFTFFAFSSSWVLVVLLVLLSPLG